MDRRNRFDSKEIGDWNRFTGNTIGAYLALVPSDHSSSASRSPGAITKTGNTHSRRLIANVAVARELAGWC
jgi:transposase